MPQFVVPQFIDVEDKIIGPITIRQFIMGVVILLVLFLAYRLADLALFIIEAVFLLGFYILVAFIKVNGRPSYYFALNLARSIKRPALRVWDKSMVHFISEQSPQESEDEETDDKKPVPRRKLLAQQELSSLSLMVDTGGKYRPEAILAQKKQTKQS